MPPRRIPRNVPVKVTRGKLIEIREGWQNKPVEIKDTVEDYVPVIQSLIAKEPFL